MNTFLLNERPIQPNRNPVHQVTSGSSKMGHMRQWLSRFRIRLYNWEYWPFAVVYIPVFAYYLYLAAKARSLFFFSAANPSIESGGFLGESKIDILDLIDDVYKPKTLFFRHSVSINQILNRMVLAGFWFPIIAKPNQGERGWGVEKLYNEDELSDYLRTNHMDLIVQQYVDESIELGVFYYRMPNQKTGTISSVVQKEFLSITGDGQSTMRQLICQSDRAQLQLPALTKRYEKQLNDVLDRGQVVQLMPIGNHCRGTKFLNANHLITPELVAVFDQISLSIDGFYYGRYDLRCRSIEELYRGKYIRILELNGAGAEPAHIYHPGFSLWQGWRILLQHWHVLYTISRENHRLGVPYMTLEEARSIYRRIKTYRKPKPTL
ncbi:D-alanine--D-alanine ligase [Spirosoma flavus]